MLSANPIGPLILPFTIITIVFPYMALSPLHISNPRASLGLQPWADSSAPSINPVLYFLSCRIIVEDSD